MTPIEEALQALMPWMGGAAGITVLTLLGAAYHHWKIRQYARRQAEALETLAGEFNE